MGELISQEPDKLQSWIDTRWKDNRLGCVVEHLRRLAGQSMTSV